MVYAQHRLASYNSSLFNPCAKPIGSQTASAGTVVVTCVLILLAHYTSTERVNYIQDEDQS